MDVSVTTGQTVDLVPGDDLRQVRMGLGWGPITRTRPSGKVQRVAVDLDASALLVSAQKEILEVVYFGHMSTVDGSIRHSGDIVSGRGDGDDESIDVDLKAVSPDVAHIVFVVNSYSGQSFEQIANATARVVDSTRGDRELVRYTLTGFGRNTAVVMGSVSRSGPGWTFTAIGALGNARTARELEPLTLTALR